MRSRPLAPPLFLLLAAAFSLPLHAGEVVVQVTGPRAVAGNIGCALFGAQAGFPMDNSGARQIWLPAEATTVCRFANVSPGRHAVSVSHDLNGNGRVDTNFLGIPLEGWAVSNNVVPSLRAPRFEEAAFRVDDETPLVLNLKLVN